MGLIVDSNVFISMERKGAAVDLSHWDATAEVSISAITVSELLAGVYRASKPAHRQRREQFVETIIGNVNVLDFTEGVARRHAVLYADLSVAGTMIGAHDLIIAATCVYHGLPLLTANRREFSRVPGLSIVDFSA